MLKKIRRTLAVLCFIAVTLLFLDFTGTLHHWLGWTAKIQLVPAVLALNFVIVAALVVITLIFGRIYCSVICPLGVMQDFISWLHGKRKKNRFTYSKEIKWLRYPVLVIFIVAIVMGIGGLMAILEPYGTYGLIATNLFQPIYEWCNNGIGAIAEHYNNYSVYPAHVWIKSVASMATAVSLFVIIAILAWRGGRTYCNTICPVGTLLSFFSRFSLLKVRIDNDKCIKCGMCTRNCKASCIDHENGTVDHSRCVTCGNCIEKCHKDAIYYGRPRKAADTAAQATEQEAENTQTVDKGKRAWQWNSTCRSCYGSDQEKGGWRPGCHRRTKDARAQESHHTSWLDKRPQHGSPLRSLPAVCGRVSKSSSATLERPRNLHAAHNELRTWLLSPRVQPLLECVPHRRHQAHHP